jgi:Uri superfamily endonuclease
VNGYAPEQPRNAVLYETGRRYAKGLDRLKAGDKKKVVARDVATECSVPVEKVRAAIAFADAVDRIVANCGDAAKTLILSDHPRLPAKVVLQISRTHAERQRFALAQARADRNPFGKPPPGTEPPFDTLGYAEVLSRLARNAGLLDHVAEGLHAGNTSDGSDVASDILGDIDIILRACRQMTELMKSAGGQLGEDGAARCRRDRRQVRALTSQSAARFVASVRAIAEKNTRDLPRVVRETPPTQTEADTVLEGVRRLRRAAERLAAVVRASGHDRSTGPSEVPGTYVVVYYLPKAASKLTIGALGVFDFPAGYYAYLGSAFGGGGVRKRTHRHLTETTPRKWNVDHLKPLCTPVAVWWTHDRDKAEFDWAEILGSMPGSSVPAPRFGAADNKKAEAHLVRFDRMPSITEFRRRVQAAMPCHAPIHAKTVSRWTGRGWPE